MQETPTITAAEIARLAGVGRAAVSNWRKRHPDFPAPVGGTSASPEFDLIQVEQWLRAQGKLPELAPADRLWRHLVAASQSSAVALATVGDLLLARHRGRPARRSDPDLDPQLVSLMSEIESLADELGPQRAFDELWQCFSAPGPGRAFATPDNVADLMAALADAAPGDVHGIEAGAGAEARDGSVFDPAAGSGALLRAAVRAGATSAYGQELDDGLARLAGLWLALRDVPGEVATGDSLRADAFAGRTADAVVCHPPFGLTNWGDEELGHDPRWIVGSTPRTEPELAWVQHALAHLRVGGHAVLLMPPTVASRRAGRRIRAELLRRGALRAVVALPPGVAAPHGVPLHLWVLRRPAPDAPPPARTLLIDAAAGDPAVTYPRVLGAWRTFAAGPDAEANADVDEAGFARAVPVIELLDEEVDLTPARRQPAVAGAATGAHLVRVRARLAAVVADLPELLPQVTQTPDGVSAPDTLSVAELARTGALQLIGPVRAPTGGEHPSSPPREQTADGGPVLTGRDVVAGVEASGRDDNSLPERIPLVTGDVVVPAAARRLTSRVVTADGTLLGTGLYLLRPNPVALDPWFLAAQLSSSTNDRQTTSLSGARIDVRRALIRRLPPDEQRVHGRTYQRVLALAARLGEIRTLGAELIRLTADGLAAGTLRPEVEIGETSTISATADEGG